MHPLSAANTPRTASPARTETNDRPSAAPNKPEGWVAGRLLPLLVFCHRDDSANATTTRYDTPSNAPISPKGPAGNSPPVVLTETRDTHTTGFATSPPMAAMVPRLDSGGSAAQQETANNLLLVTEGLLCGRCQRRPCDTYRAVPALKAAAGSRSIAKKSVPAHSMFIVLMVWTATIRGSAVSLLALASFTSFSRSYEAFLSHDWGTSVPSSHGQLLNDKGICSICSQINGGKRRTPICRHSIRPIITGIHGRVVYSTQ